MLKRSMFVLFVGLAFVSTAVQAETMAVKAQWEKINQENNGYLETLNAACGSKIKLDIDKASFKEVEEISNFFWAVSEGVANVCKKGEEQKKTVAGKIKTIKMSYGKEKYSVKDGTLSYVTDLGKTNGRVRF